MLTKFHTLILKCLIVTWTIHCLCAAGDLIAWAYRYQLDPFSNSLDEVLLAFCDLVWLYKVGPAIHKAHRFSPSIWAVIAKDYPILAMARSLFLVFSSLIFVVFSTSYLWFSFRDADRSLAFTADALGGHELAERIYSLQRLREPGLNLAIWLNRAEPEATRLARNAAVAKVYGPESLEMARRYYAVGLTLEPKNTDQLSTYEAYPWFEKSLPIFYRHHADRRCIDALSQMAIIQSAKEHKDEARSLVVEASRLLSSSDAGKSYYLGVLSGIAKDLGEEKLSKAFRLKSSLASTTLSSDYIISDALYVSLALSLAFSVGPFSRFFEQFLLPKLYSRYNKLHLTTGNADESLTALNRLIDLDLYRGNVARAFALSTRLCRSVGLAVNSMDDHTITPIRSTVRRVHEFILQLDTALLICLYILCRLRF